MNRQISIIDLFLMLRGKTDEQGTQELVEYSEQHVAQKSLAVKPNSHTSWDLQNL